MTIKKNTKTTTRSEKGRERESETERILETKRNRWADNNGNGKRKSENTKLTQWSKRRKSRYIFFAYFFFVCVSGIHANISIIMKLEERHAQFENSFWNIPLSIPFLSITNSAHTHTRPHSLSMGLFLLSQVCWQNLFRTHAVHSIPFRSIFKHTEFPIIKYTLLCIFGQIMS